jgi:DNA-binding transcriptional regulator YiaG
MPNIAQALKEEISRVARKEVRAETESLKKNQSAQRHEIVALRKLVQELERKLRGFEGRRVETSERKPEEETGRVLRFSAKGFATRRQALGLSASDVGLLLGTSGQSIYAWETGKSHPRAKYLPAIAALRSLGKKEAAAVLEKMRVASN